MKKLSFDKFKINLISQPQTKHLVGGDTCTGGGFSHSEYRKGAICYERSWTADSIDSCGRTKYTGYKSRIVYGAMCSCS